MLPESRIAARAAGALTALLLVAVAIASLPTAPPLAPPAPGPVTVPFAVSGVRALVPAAAQLWICNPGGSDAPLRLGQVRIVADGAILARAEVDVALPADPRLNEALVLLERLPNDVTHREGPRRFAGTDEPEYAGAELPTRWNELRERISELSLVYEDPARRPFVAVDLTLPLDQVFAPEDPPGAVREVAFELDWKDDLGDTHTIREVHRIERLAPFARVPALLSGTGYTAFAGDLHVHSCHGEAVNSCAPSEDCTAETAQLSGSFSFAQLRSQFEALGVSWFAATDHSYCINSQEEYDIITAEIAAVTEPGVFVAFSDTEVSSDEVGPQDDHDDLADLFCLDGTHASHMGAHDSGVWIYGGWDDLLGFCNTLFSDALNDFLFNISLVNTSGGWTIAHHPTDDLWGWNSFEMTQGIEANGLHGVEAWNGVTAGGQDSYVGRWIEWLLAGRVLYGYGGSDTHDEAKAAGFNHALLSPGEVVDLGTVQAALRAGRVYISDGPALVLEVEQAGTTHIMGRLQGVGPSSPAESLTVRASYDLGAGSGTVTIFQGREGDAAETVLCQSATVSGSGVLECGAPLYTGGNSWFRAYTEGAGVAYSNPVFFVHSTCAATPYGEGAGGANVGTLASSDPATIGGAFRIEISGLPAAPLATLVVSPTSDPGTPLMGGTLLVGLADVIALPVPLTGGAGTIWVDLPAKPNLVGNNAYWQAAGADPAQPFGFAFTNGLETTFCGVAGGS